MAFHRDHVAPFVATQNLSPDVRAAIERRAEDAAAEYGSVDEGNFSGSSLDEVLGSPELADIFREMWETQRSALDSI